MWIKHSRKLTGKIFLCLVILLLGGLVFSGCTRGAQPKGWSGGTIDNDTLFLGSMEGKLVAIDLSNHTKLWETPLETTKSSGGFTFGCAPATTSVAIYGNPAVGEDFVYIGGYNGRIYAFNPSTGLSKDRYLDENKPKPIVGGPVVALGKVYIGSSDGKLYALDPATLDKEWEFLTGNKIWSTPAIDGDTIFIGSLDKNLYALSATNGNKKWEFATEGAIASTPVVYNDMVYIGSLDRHIYAIETTSGKLRWKSEVEADNWFWATPIAYNDVIYAPCLDGKVYLLNAKNGDEIRDAIDLGSPISSSPVLVDGKIIIASQEGRIHSLDTDTHQKRELNNLEEEIYAPLCASNGTIYVHTADRTLYALNEQTGMELWKLAFSK